MIPKPQLMSIATENGLLPSTVEKDYALGWMLVGIARHPQLSRWVFKGGTCLKKCFFETYRFSEDLDFTVPADGLYTLEGIQAALGEVTRSITEETGIQFPADKIEVKESINKRGKKTFIAKATFIGPLNQPKASQQRIKFDLTQDEIVVDGSSLKAISHPYSDAVSPMPSVQCYTINEVLAEKTRAMYERQGTPRDIYDVINIGRNFREDVDPARARITLLEKFRFKGLPDPTVDMILSRVEPATIKANWEPSLGHQVRILPPAESFIDDLKESLEWWMEVKPSKQVAAPISSAFGEVVVPKEHLIPPYTVTTGQRLGVGRASPHLGLNRPSLDIIRFAARNRLKVAITYKGIRRVVEPYSLRRLRTGNTLLYVYELERGSGPGGGIKAFNVALLGDAEALSETFHARYVVEL
jgi:predicted nucleotidyltransferase component of viral defense system